MKIVKYRLVYDEARTDGPSDEANNLEKRVNELIAEGWQPLGGPFDLATDPGFGLLHTATQAMVKYEDS